MQRQRVAELEGEAVEVALPALELLLVARVANAAGDAEAVGDLVVGLGEGRVRRRLERVGTVDLEQAAGEMDIVGQVALLVEVVAAR